MSEHTGIDDDAARRLATALARLEGLRRHQRRFADLGEADMRLLWLLRESGPQTLSQIGAALGLERSTVNRQVNAAAAAGLLIKERVPGSSALRVSVSGDGLAAFERGARAAVTSIGEVLSDIGASDAQQLIALTERFVAALSRRAEPDRTD